MAIATLIGDVVGSRRAADRAALHASLSDVLQAVNDELVPDTPLRVTVGDEYQGAFRTVGEALRASLRLHVALRLDGVDVRHGVGWGTVNVLTDLPRVEDGPGWWMAREAIEAVEAAQRQAASRRLRTSYRRAPGVEGPDPAAVNAALVARDELLGGVDERGVSVLSGMLTGMSQAEISARLGISASAVSQRVRRESIAALLRVDQLLGEVG